MKELSRLLGNVPGSATMAVSEKARRLKAAGKDVIALGGGDPDFATPDHIIAAAFSAIEDGATHYPPSRGIPLALEAIASKLARENDVQVDPASQIIITPGAKWAIYLALAALSNPGDEILYIEPCWASYPPMVTLAGATPVPVSLSPDDNYTVTAESLRACVTDRTKALMVNSPCNPTGRVLTADEVDAVVEVALEHDLYVLSDEIYEHLVYDDNQNISLAARPGMAERTLTINGLSKAYAMTGWRMGWLAGPAQVINLANKLSSQTVSMAANFSMHAAAAALNGPQDCVAEMVASYKQRRDFMVSALNAIDGVQCRNIEGAFYLFPSFPGSDKDSLALAEVLIQEAGIAGTPGIAFGSTGEGHIRFSIATAMEDLERSAERLAQVAPRL